LVFLSPSPKDRGWGEANEIALSLAYVLNYK
jgi:hypothetical protein